MMSISSDAIYYREVARAFYVMYDSGKTPEERRELNEMYIWAAKQRDRYMASEATPVILSSGQRIVLKENKKEGWPEEHGFFLEIVAKDLALVQVEPHEADDDGLREVGLKQIKLFYDHPSDRMRRAKHVIRSFRMGVRVFRHMSPDGKQFTVQTIDPVLGFAFGMMFKRKTIQSVALYDLFPDHR